MKPRRAASRTGLNALKARVKVRGLQAIDRRTSAARALLDWRRDLLDDLGGEAAVSAQHMALVEAVVRIRLYVDHLDAWLMEHRSQVNARRRAVHPVVRERQQLVDSLARLLGLLGLERRQPKAVDLSAYLRDRALRLLASGEEASRALPPKLQGPEVPSKHTMGRHGSMACERQGNVTLLCETQ